MSVSLTNISSVVQDDLNELEKSILTGFDSDIGLIKTIGEHIIGHGGKKLRPITVILSARAFGYEGNKHILIAAILEFIHAATLLHDDVVDRSTMRRGQSSANSVWGNSASVLVGDFLYSRSFEMMVQVGEPLVFDILSYTTRRISEGEVMQLINLQSAQTDEVNYFDTIERKTASLFQAAAQLGAVLGKQDPDIQNRMAKYGRKLGIAFQLMDDVLDYMGDSEKIGKRVGDDLAEGKMTLPLIYALEHGSAGQQDNIRNAIENPDSSAVSEIRAIVESAGGLEYTVTKTRNYASAAIEQIQFLNSTVYREALVELARFAGDRNF